MAEERGKRGVGLRGCVDAQPTSSRCSRLELSEALGGKWGLSLVGGSDCSFVSSDEGFVTPAPKNPFF